MEEKDREDTTPASIVYLCVKMMYDGGFESRHSQLIRGVKIHNFSNIEFSD